MLDQQNRLIDYLRISVTDRCNLRCRYCMPEEGVQALSHSKILRYEELLRLAHLFSSLGIRRIRLTGGEPLVREGLPSLIAGMKAIHGIRTVCLSTNGTLLAAQLPSLLAAGLDGVNISLDTLDAAQYAAITRRDQLSAALEGLNAALSTPRLKVKLNCVPTVFNKNQWTALAALARDHSGLDVRFIELMPLGAAAAMQRISEQELLRTLKAQFGHAVACPPDAGGGPSRYVRFPGFQGRIGFISAVSHAFCAHCNRIRLTASGELKPCLCYNTGSDLRSLLRDGADNNKLRNVIAGTIHRKPHAHDFGLPTAPEDEQRFMNQIGG